MRFACAVLTAVCSLACCKAQPCPEPPILVFPLDPVDALAPGAPPDAVARAWAQSRALWRFEAQRRQLLLDAYRKPEVK